MKTSRARLVGDGLRFRATSGSGHVVTADSAEGDAGARPAELLLMALASCSAMDVIAILRKKRQPVERYEVTVTDVQRPGHSAVFERVEVVHILQGIVEPEAVRRAIELSATLYCAVGTTLSSGVTQIRHAYGLLRAGALLEAEVCTTGPYEPVELPAAVAG